MKNLFLNLIIFLLINSGGGIYFVIANIQITFLLLILLVFYFIIFNIKVEINRLKASTVVLFVFIFLLGINYVVALPGQSPNTYASMALTFFIAFLSINLSRNEQLLDAIYKVLVFVEIQSLIGFLLSFIVYNNLQSIVIGDDWKYYTFYYLFFYPVEEFGVREVGSFQMIRNQGVFWEPGILQLFLNILLFLKFFYFPKSIPNIAITLMAIISTFSTTGLLIMGMLLVYKYKTILNIKRLVVYFPVVIIVIGLLTPIIMSNIEDKFYGKNAMSGFVRQFDTLQALSIIQDYPVTGIGITVEVIQKVQWSYKSVFGLVSDDPAGNTNSVLGIMVRFGVPIGLFFLFLLYQQNIFYKHRGIFFLMLVIALSTEPLLHRGFFIILMFSGLQNLLMPKKNKAYQ